GLVPADEAAAVACSGGEAIARRLARGRRLLERRHPPERAGSHGREAECIDAAKPDGTAVGARAESVQERERPRSVGPPVDRAPDAVAEAPAQQARQDERGDEIERKGAEADPERRPAGGERDDD